MSKNKNKIIVASAGSGKTTGIIQKVKKNLDKNILITTYTNGNIGEIYTKFFEDIDLEYIPENIEILTLFNFLLSHGVKPYQSELIDIEKGRVKSIDFESTRPLKISKTKKRAYYLNKNNDIYVNYVTEFVCENNKKSGGKIIKRLEKIYDLIIVDEIQDIKGKYDLEFFELLLRSKIEILLVGDYRQAILNTNTSSKGKKDEKGSGIIKRFSKWEKDELCELTYENISYRCCQKICDFADKLFPDVPKTKSQRKDVSKHQGIFVTKEDEKSILEYLHNYEDDDIKIIRYNKNHNPFKLKGLNVGNAKGQTWNRTIIFFPQKDLNRFLESGIPNFPPKTKSQLYVALTRARYSVLLVADSEDIIFDEIERIKSPHNLKLFNIKK